MAGEEVSRCPGEAKFQEPWFTICMGIKEILEELGCNVRNPNTGNKALGGVAVRAARLRCC